MKRVGLVLLLASAMAMAQGPRFGGPGRGGAAGRMAFAGQGMGKGVARALDNVDEVKAYLTLTDAQVTLLQQIRKDEFTANQSLHDQVMERRTALRTALQATSPTAAELGGILLEIKNLQSQLGQNREKYRAQAVALLTDAQKPKLAALEAAAALRPTISQAMALNLLTPPVPPAGMAGPEGGGPRMGPGAPD